MHKQIYFLAAFTILFTCSCNNHEEKVEVRNDLNSHYEDAGVIGTFVLYDPAKHRTLVYNQQMAEQPLTPASTFKICNSLIGLETGVITDANFVIAWDSIKRNPVWDQDHTLQTAFRNSTVWYYQELARRVGGTRMKEWLDKTGYGDADTSGGIDRFWLEGGLRISPMQQIDFLIRLRENKLPFSHRNMDIVKQIMIEEDIKEATVRSKTGWGLQDSMEVGWYVGYVETGTNVYYFANCIQLQTELLSNPEAAKQFDKARKQIAWKVLDQLGVMKHVNGKQGS